MTNREALKGEINIAVPQGTIDLNLAKQDVDPEADFNPLDADNVRGVDLALAGLIRFVCLSPKSVRELEFLLTNHDIDDLLKIRAGILRKYGLPDEMDDGPVVESVSDLW